MIRNFLNAIKKTNAESFPQKIEFSVRDYIALLFVPLIFLMGYFFTGVLKMEPINAALADSLFRAFLFVLICFIYGHLLSSHWKKFQNSKWQSWLLVIIGGIVLQILISLSRQLLPDEGTTTEIAKNAMLTDEKGIPKPSLIIFIIALGPVFTSLIEDIVFRYTLLGKFFIPGKVWRVILVLLNSVVFGLIHFNNFGGNILATTSFMTAGLFLNLVYLWTKNIWHVLLIHAVNNFVLSVLGLLILWLISALFGS